MRKGPFLPTQFTATQWSTQDDKAEFGNALLHFIDSGFKQTLFTKKLYQRLSNTYGHIAHYNQGGFWEVWFSTDADRARFIEHLLRWRCYGDPEFTFSDVERVLQTEARQRDYLSRYRAIADASLRAKEVAMLESLEAKYRTANVATATDASTFAQPSPRIEPQVISERVPVQGTLF
jgi:hypothetical protein